MTAATAEVVALPSRDESVEDVEQRIADMVADLPFRPAIVQLDQLFADVYQRPLSSFVKKIEKKFNPALVGALCLSQRSATKYAVIDGWTRATGMQRIGMTHWLALVFEGMTREQEAELFALFQTERRAMTSASRFNAQVVSNRGFASELNQIIEDLGFKVSSDSKDGPGAIRAIAAVEWVYRGCSARKASTETHPELVTVVLETIKDAWPAMPDTAKGARLVKGLGEFYRRMGVDKVDQEKLAARLSRTTPTKLAKRAEAFREAEDMPGNATPTHMADAILATYKKQPR